MSNPENQQLNTKDWAKYTLEQRVEVAPVGVVVHDNVIQYEVRHLPCCMYLRLNSSEIRELRDRLNTAIAKEMETS